MYCYVHVPLHVDHAFKSDIPLYVALKSISCSVTSNSEHIHYWAGVRILLLVETWLLFSIKATQLVIRTALRVGRELCLDICRILSASYHSASKYTDLSIFYWIQFWP